MWPLRSLRLAPLVALGAGIALVGLVGLARMTIPSSPSIVGLHSLTLDIANTDMCEFHSSFDVQPVFAEDGVDHIELQQRFEKDGCTWRSFERLDRAPGAKTFTYSYREAPMSCEPTSADACRRVGLAHEVQ